MMSHASGKTFWWNSKSPVTTESSRAGAGSATSPVGGEVLHVDFHAVSMDETIQAEVPLEPRARPMASKFGGVLEQIARARD